MKGVSSDDEKPKPELTSNIKGDVLRGNSVNLYCTLTPQSAGWKFYWSENKQSSWTETETGSTSDSYTISSVYYRIQYRCRAGRENRVFYTDYSNELSLNVIESPKPTVTINPDTQVFIGETVTFSCDVQKGRDTEWTYGWFRDNNILPTFYPYSTTKEFSIRSVTVSHRGQYTCRGRRTSDSQMSEMSDPVTLSVSEKPKPTVIVTRQSSFYTGDTVTLSCNLMSTGWKFFWYVGQKWNSHYIGDSDTKTHTVPVSYEGRVNYYCIARRGNYDSERSEPATITVTEKPKPELTSNIKGDVLRGNSVTLSCTLTPQSAGWKFYWIKRTQSHWTETKTGSTSDTYIISSVRVSDGGQYRCRAGRGSPVYYTDYSNELSLTVIEKPKPVLIIKPDKQVFRGETVTFRCEIHSAKDTKWTYNWYKKDYTKNSYKETQEFSISSVTDSDSDTYTCRGMSSDSQFSKDSDPVTLTVSEKPKPQLTSSLKGAALRGNSVTLSCTLTPKSAGWKFYWSKYTQSRWTETTSDTYTISSDKVYDGNQYKCRAGRGNPVYYTDYSDELSLTVNESPKPTVTINPDTQVFIYETVTFRCDVEEGRDTEWTYGWFRDSNPLYSYSTTKEFSISYVTDSHRGQYTCRGRRTSDYQMSQMSDSVTLSVSEKPKPTVIVTRQSSFYTGDTVTLSCNLMSTGWKFLWYEGPTWNSHYIGDSDTNTHTVPVSYEGRVNYYCQARRGNYDSERSEPATITVTEKPKPQLTSSLKGAALTGNSVTLYCTLTPQSAGWMFYWSKYTGSVWTETKYNETDSYTISSVILSDGGQYKCRAGRGNPVYYTDYSDVLWVNVIGESSPVSLTIRPSRTQHFTAESLSLSCEDQSDSTGWTVRRYTHSETWFDCSSVSGSTCNISSLSTSHTGVYWCQSESGERSNSVNITVHNDVILDSPVHPVTEGQPLILRCLSKQNPSNSGVYFYKNDSILQNQTTGEMIISSVSKTDEGFYHCKHPERGESPKSWVSVRVSAPGFTGLFIGLGLACLFAIVMILLLLLFKKKKGVQSQSPAVNQDTNQPAVGDNIYENAAIMTTDDSAAASSNTVYPQVMARKKKQNESDAEPSDVTYAEIDMKHIKKPKRKQGKSSEGADTVYSELKQNTDNEDLAETGDVTYAQVIMKGKKYNAGKITENADQTYAQVRIKAKNAGP